ncbi:MAG: HEAT repeat domain-containing protein, partial [Planctomycetes bacterium]|nr:HEAT repeat domain-containing protein [Planctomycetota bacterium]
CAYFQQFGESSAAVAAISARAKIGEVPAEVLTKLQEDLKGIEKANLFGKMAGKRYLYRALDRAITDENPVVAVACLNTLRDAGEAEDLPLPLLNPQDESTLSAQQRDLWEAERRTKVGYPLVKALIHGDKRVRYAAAEALVAINPKKRFLGSDRVVPVLAEALNEVSVRTILVVDPDPEVRNRLKAEIIKLGYFPTEAATGIDGILKAKNFPGEDAILLDSKTAGTVIFAATVLNKDHTQTVFDSIKEDVRSKATPVIILATADGMEQAKSIFKDLPSGYLVKSPAYLSGPEDRALLKTELEKLFASEEAQKDGKARAQQVVESAAWSLSKIDPNNAVFDRVEAVQALIGNLNDRPDSTRAAAAKALGRIGDPTAIEPLSKVFEVKENAKEVRVAAGQGLAGVFRNSHALASDPVFAVLKGALMEEEFEVSSAAADALGNAALTAVQQKEVFQARRY